MDGWGLPRLLPRPPVHLSNEIVVVCRGRGWTDIGVEWMNKSMQYD